MGSLPFATVEQKQVYDRDRRVKLDGELRIQRREYYLAHKESLNASSRKWSAANRSRINDARRITRYGVTPEQYDQMLLEQGGFCVICDLPMGRPDLDHDHATGKVRKLLCASCNKAIGMMQEDPDRLRAAAQYLEDNA